MKKFTIFVGVETNKPLEGVQKALSRGLDSPPYHIAPPKKVNIKF